MRAPRSRPDRCRRTPGRSCTAPPTPSVAATPSRAPSSGREPPGRVPARGRSSATASVSTASAATPRPATCCGRAGARAAAHRACAGPGLGRRRHRRRGAGHARTPHVRRGPGRRTRAPRRRPRRGPAGPRARTGAPGAALGLLRGRPERRLGGRAAADVRRRAAAGGGRGGRRPVGPLRDARAIDGGPYSGLVLAVLVGLAHAYGDPALWSILSSRGGAPPSTPRRSTWSGWWSSTPSRWRPAPGGRPVGRPGLAPAAGPRAQRRAGARGPGVPLPRHGRRPRARAA